MEYMSALQGGIDDLKPSLFGTSLPVLPSALRTD